MTNPITTKTPAQVEIEKILEQHFPSVNFGNEEAEVEVDIIAIKNAIAQAFAAGRDFEGTRRDRRAQRDEKTERKAKIRCAHCGEEGERAGHQGCQYPQEVA